MNIFQKEIDKYKVFLRKNSPDETVATSCLGSEFDLICKLLENIKYPTTVLDLGGYIGTAAIKFASAIPYCTVISVEPSPENFFMLQLNVMNYPNIIPVNTAVGNTKATAKIYSRGTGEWGHTLVSEPKDCKNPSELATVDVLSIRDILEKFSPDQNRLSLVKIDIEGAEVFLFNDDVWVENVPIIAVELHDRIQDGCTESWTKATRDKDRYEVSTGGEKKISIRPDLLYNLHLDPKPRAQLAVCMGVTV